MTAAGLSLRFWGVRGSIPCPGPETIRYGGNTACVEVRCGDRLIILDAGSGIRPLGQGLLANGPVEADILLSHTHLDHILGLPFFAPAYAPGNRFRIRAGHLPPGRRIEEVLCDMMMAPLFPIPMEVMGAEKSFHDFRAGDTLTLAGGVVVRTCALNHPNGATGYRIEFAGKSVCYVTDTEHVGETLDANILALIEGTDVFVYDATYTPEEYEAHRGWGHSTWEAGARLAERAGVDRYLVFHHDPTHDDATMDRIAAHAAARFPRAEVAREGMEIAL